MCRVPRTSLLEYVKPWIANPKGTSLKGSSANRVSVRNILWSTKCSGVERILHTVQEARNMNRRSMWQGGQQKLTHPQHSSHLLPDKAFQKIKTATNCKTKPESATLGHLNSLDTTFLTTTST